MKVGVSGSKVRARGKGLEAGSDKGCRWKDEGRLRPPTLCLSHSHMRVTPHVSDLYRLQHRQSNNPLKVMSLLPSFTQTLTAVFHYTSRNKSRRWC